MAWLRILAVFVVTCYHTAIAVEPAAKTVTISELTKDFSENAVRAGLKYKRSPLILLGYVSDVEVTLFGDALVKITDSGHQHEAHAYLHDSNFAAAAKLSKGDLVVLKCATVNNVLMLALLDCFVQ